MLQVETASCRKHLKFTKNSPPELTTSQLTLLPLTGQIHFKKPGQAWAGCLRGQRLKLLAVAAVRRIGTEEPNLVWKEKQHGGLKI